MYYSFNMTLSTKDEQKIASMVHLEIIFLIDTY